MKYENLRDKSIFDFCDDQKILDKIMIVLKKDYLEHVKSNIINNGFDLLDLAEMIGNKELEKAVRHDYKDEFEQFYDE